MRIKVNQEDIDKSINIELTKEAINWRTKYYRGEKVEPIELSFSSERIYKRKI